MLKITTKKTPPIGVGGYPVPDGEDEGGEAYIKGVAHVVLPVLVGLWFPLFGFAWFAVAFGLYCSVFRSRSQGFFFAVALVVFFVVLGAIPA